MRLPWPFGRRTPSDGLSSATPEDTPGGATPVNASPIPGSGLAPATGAWASLPPIQRTTSDPPLVAPAAPFLAGVAGHRSLPPIVQPLGHETSRTAPPGLVVAHVSTVASLTSRAPMPTRHAQRHAADAAPPDGAGNGSPEPRTGTMPASAAPASAAPSSLVATAPVRSLAIVSPATRVMPDARPLVRSPVPVAVAQPSAGRSGASTLSSSASLGRPAASMSAAAPGLQSASGARSTPPLRGIPAARTASRWAETPSTSPAPAAGLGAPLSPPPDAASRPGVREMPSSAGAAAASSAPSAQLPEAPGAATSRRAGLGAPLAISPDSAVAQRLPLGRPTRRPGAPSSPETAPAATPFATPSPGGQVATTTPAPGRPLPVLPVAHRRADAAEAPASATRSADLLPTGAGSASDAARAHHVASTVSASAAAAPTLPTLGFRPLRSVVTAQRGAAAASPAGAKAVFSARRGPGDDLPATVLRSTPRQAGNPGAAPVSLQRLGSVPVDAPATGSPSIPREVVFPQRDESPGGWPAGDTSAGAGGFSGRSGFPDVERQPGTASLPGLAPVSPASSPFSGRAAAHPAAVPPGPLGLARPPVTRLAAAPAPALAPLAARIVAGPASPTIQPMVQASPASAGGSSAGGFTATPVVQRVDGAAPAAPSEEGRSESELDELAGALFGRFRTRLRAEVIHEREARGLSFDAF